MLREHGNQMTGPEREGPQAAQTLNLHLYFLWFNSLRSWRYCKRPRNKVLDKRAAKPRGEWGEGLWNTAGIQNFESILVYCGKIAFAVLLGLLRERFGLLFIYFLNLPLLTFRDDIGTACVVTCLNFGKIVSYCGEMCACCVAGAAPWAILCCFLEIHLLFFFSLLVII